MRTAMNGPWMAALLLAAAASPAGAATITVDTTADAIDSNGDCSLREAVISANQDGASDGCTAGSGVDTIELPADVGTVPHRGVYILDKTGAENGNAVNGDLDLNSEVIITGVETAGGNPASADDVVVRAGNGFNSRAFDVRSPAAGSNFAISGLTVRGFETSNPGSAFRIDASPALGTAALSLQRVQILDNRASAGALWQQEGALSTARTTFAGNSASSGNGGAVFLRFNAEASFENTTFVDNSARTNGGALSSTTNGDVRLDNVTITGNSAGGRGGGMDLSQGTGQMVVRNTIIAGNRADGTGADCDDSGNIFVDSQTGFNLVGDTSGCSKLVDGNSVGDTDPALAARGRYNGEITVVPPRSASPAIDAGSCSDSEGSDIAASADQRGGNSRDIDGDGDGSAGCDIGAIERQKPALVVDSARDSRDQNPGNGSCMDASGDCTLRAAIDEANAADDLDEIILPGDTVTLALSGSGEDANATGDLDVDAATIIQGQGADASTIDAAGLDRVFDHGPSQPNTLSLGGVTITGGSVSQFGGGIQSSGELRLTETRLTGNEDLGSINGTASAIASDGLVPENANFRMVRSVVDGNSGPTNAVIYGLSHRAPNAIIDSTITDNGASSAQSIYERGELRITGSTIADNGDDQLFAALSDARIELHDTAVTDPSQNNCIGSGAIVSRGNNLENGSDCGFTQASDVQDTAADLAALADVGTELPLRVPQAASALVDAGSCTTAKGGILERMAFGGTRPQDGDADGSGTGDGTYDCDIGAAERQQLRAAAGANNPGKLEAAAGASGVAVTHLSITNRSGEPIDGSSVTVAVSGSGSGDESTDVSRVRLFLDQNNNGEFDPNTDVQRGQAQVFAKDNGTVTFDFANSPSTPSDLGSGNSAQYLVVYDFATQLAGSGMRIGNRTALAGLTGGGMLAVLAGTLACGSVRRRKKWGAMASLAVMTLLLGACGGGSGGGSNGSGSGGGTSQTETFAAAVDDISVTGANSGRVIKVRTRPIQGATVTVSE